ncbi:MAG: 16S rRNA (adenine(1518)-N(6)/adenine(1519)-N(6))-dimethyltransferase RsmA [Gammaproteobacteria bacterium]|nr:16S rRNA (adenine(1518)-N(6)/adenine(1519)-N(6))-dimethyltransferase RsmA [Gammaproteobacteria bacterium]
MVSQTSYRVRKRFGQHFLVDPTVVQQIVQVVHPGASDHIVEIGPGLGVLTEALISHVKQMDAVELDRDIIPRLKANILPLGNLRIHSADALTFDFCALMQQSGTPGQPLRIVGNLPYNISTPLIFRLIEQIQCILDMVFMLQKEVVDRIVADPGHSAYGKLSVMLQYHCYAEKCFDVPPSAFSPPPKVESSIVRLLPYKKPPVNVSNFSDFASIVAASFAQRRKTLRNNLKGLLNEQQITSANIDPQRRAETLSLDEFAKLSHLLSCRADNQLG